MKVWVYYIIGIWLVGRAFSLLIEDNEKDVAEAERRGFNRGFGLNLQEFTDSSDG